MKNKKHWKSLIAVICAVLIAVSLTACAARDNTETAAGDTVNTESSADADGTETITGEIISIDGDEITIREGGMHSPDGQAPPDMGQDSSEGRQAPPEMPGGEDGKGTDGKKDADHPELPDSDGSRPEPPEGDGTDTGSEKPDRPEDGRTEMKDGKSDRSENGRTVTVKLSDAASASDFKEGDYVTVKYGEDGSVKNIEKTEAAAPENGGPGGGSFAEVTERNAAAEITEDTDISVASYTSEGDDENALLITGAEVTLSNVTVNKASGSSSNAESGDFYGMNAALLAADGATVTIDDSTVTSSAQNGNGVFSYGEGTTVNVSDTTITTESDNSGGIMTTGGGTMNAENLTVTTSGNSAAAIRTDRGGGTVTVTGGTYTSKGYNSPAIYSTADITVSGAELTAENSEALVIEGKNSIDLTDCTVSGNMSDTKGSSSDVNVHCIFIYQSMSGDAESGLAEFSMNGGTVINNNGDVFFVTNTACTIDLTDVEIVNNETNGYLMLISGNSASHGWGSAGSNGGQAEVNVTDQELEGDIAVDSISSLDLTLSGSSVLTGTVNIIENAEGGSSDSSYANVTVENGSTWILTGDCTLTSLVNNGTVDFNGYTITLADGTVLNG